MGESPKVIPVRNASSSSPRKRRLQDLIQIVTLFEKEGLLCQLDSSHEEFVSKRVQELSVIASISVKCAKGLLILKGLRENEGVWTFLKESSALRVFDGSNFFTDADQPHQKKEDLFPLTFLQRFVNDKNSSLQQKKLQKDKKLDSIALKFTASARDICVEMFLKSAAVIATLCSFFPAEQSFDHLKTLDILDRYLSKSWNSPSRQSQYHRDASSQHAASGWHIVNATFMIQVQELQLWRERKMDTSEDAVAEVVESAEDVTENAQVFCHTVLVEFFAWIFRWRSANIEETASGFHETISEIIQEMNVKLSNELGCQNIKPVPHDLIPSTLSIIQRNAPTMADIDYDDIKMIPSRRICSNHDIEWTVKDVLMRGRWDGTPALSLYSTYIKVETLRQHQQATSHRERQASIPRSQTCSQDAKKKLDRTLHRHQLRE